MAAVSDFELVTRAINLGIAKAEEVQIRILSQLQTSASTSLMNGLRTITTFYSMICIGGLSVFEATLQQSIGWNDAFFELDKHLRSKSMIDLADRFRDYKDAINVLKHGEGRSYEKLLARKAQLEFSVKDRGQAFFLEGEVSEVGRLVNADAEFARKCSAIINEIIEAL